MSLGINRDYKTQDRKIRSRIERHAARMKELIAEGLDRHEASKRAFDELFGKPKPESELTPWQRLTETPDEFMQRVWEQGRRQFVIESLARNEFPYRNWQKHYPDLAAERLRQVAENPNLGTEQT